VKPGDWRENQRVCWDFTRLLVSMGEVPLGAYPSGAYTEIPANNENGLAMILTRPPET
jgi:hypothetical protein